MSHCFRIESIKARKNHTCTYCGSNIHKGELHFKWASVDDHFFTNRCHHECTEQMGGGGYDSYGNERPPYRLTNYGLVLLYQKWGLPIDKAQNYERPVLMLGQL